MRLFVRGGPLVSVSHDELGIRSYVIKQGGLSCKCWLQVRRNRGSGFLGGGGWKRFRCVEPAAHESHLSQDSVNVANTFADDNLIL